LLDFRRKEHGPDRLE